MLNDADGYQGSGEVDGEASGTVKDADALFSKLKRFVKADHNSKGQVNWRREAREDFDFDAGEQLNEEDKAILQDAKRPIVIFNRVGTTVDSVAGQEVGHARKPIEDRAILGLVRGRSQKLRGEVMNAGDMERSQRWPQKRPFGKSF